MEQQGTQRRRSLLTIDDVAEIMNLQPKTIRAWVGRREIPFVRVGHNVRFRPEVVDELISKGEVHPSRRRPRANPRALAPTN
jgi:excisionase family DNA binding protein